ncbi:uncharacterized protein MELLADRAFT_103884 [Melampsora larici-populina 98AG31]|uniref:Vacuolar import and degradation protein n=1 Tax=Melampsora larici-populina (strain 98AG31 / pathotype 3-4-7) TaxID=747676 RepID=F4RCV7_MELLP|nr:uncharacterized protein MELLADRAFT_103884 [Melampsora larici-populina 98AG31]EGG09790.1 hypothetical protein MELLADRAFT_103884 [Melampsora larici-populina 98AG31]
MRSDRVLDHQIESSGMKTPIELQGFEHLLPLLTTPNYNLQEIHINHQIEPRSESKENVKENSLKRLKKDSFSNTSIRSEEEEKGEIRSKEIKGLKNLIIRRDFQTDLSPLFDVVKIPNSLGYLKNQFGPLKSNSNWIGHQRSGDQVYPVSIKFLDLDLMTGNGAGLLEIDGLTEKWPKLITFFDLEIVGRGQHEFSTKRWGANHESDESHWSKFAYYHQIKHQTSCLKSNDKVLFMRWKERFLDGNPKGKEIEGASFAGFYYACLDLSDQDHENLVKKSNLNLSFKSSHSNSNSKTSFRKTNQRISTEPLPSPLPLPKTQFNLDWSNAKIKAFYYHAKSEPYQELNLRLENSKSSLLKSSATYQFC